MSAQNVSQNVKQARENALVGCYDEARVYYEGAIQDIKLLLKQTTDLDVKEKWQQVNHSGRVMGE